MSSGQALTTSELKRTLLLGDVIRSACDGLMANRGASDDAEAISRDFKREMLAAALAECDGNLCAAARLLGVHRNTASRWRVRG